MNLIVPIIEGQFAMVSVKDSKDNKEYFYMASNNKCSIMESSGITQMTPIFHYTAVEEMRHMSLLPMKVGRIKRRCAKSVFLKKHVADRKG